MKNPWLYIFGALLWLFAGFAQYIPAPSIVVPAFAQCAVTGPQTVNPPNVVSGVDSNCNLTQRQVQYTDLAFPALFGLNTTASNQVTVGLGDQVFYLDNDPGFQQGYTVQIISTIDPQVWMAGRISVYTNSGGQTQITVSVTQDQGDSFTGSGWYLQIVSSDAAFIPVTGVSLSSLTFGTSAGQISQGGVVSLGTESGLLLNNSHVVVVAIGSPTNYFRGISQYNSSTGALTIYTTDSSGSGNFTAWSLFAQDGPPVNANQIALSQTPVTIGSGQLGFTIQAGQNLPLQAPVTITALSATTNQMLGTIAAYNGTGLSVLVPSTGIYGSGNYAAWSILNTGPPQTRIPLFQQNGLLFINTSPIALTITPGSVRDSTDTVDLVVSSSLTLFTNNANGQFPSVSGAGTLTTNGTSNITGVGTNFTTFFSTAATLSDLSSQLSAFNFPAFTTSTIITISGSTLKSYSISSIGSDTALVVNGGGTASESSVSYTRGGRTTSIGASAVYGVYLARKDIDGSIGVFATSFTISGNPDLPSGYTYYRVIGFIIMDPAAGDVVAYAQPMVTNVMNTVGDMIYDGKSVPSYGGSIPTYTQRLPIGSSGQFLGVSSGLPAWTLLGPLSALGVGTGLQSSGGNLNVNLSLAFSKLTADVTLNASTYTDGPTMAQGNAGVWSVTAPITINDTASDAVNCKLWDGTTITSSQSSGITTGSKPISMTLAGILSNMTGNIRVSCISNNATTTKIKANQSGNGADSSIWGQRIQ